MLFFRNSFMIIHFSSIFSLYFSSYARWEKIRLSIKPILAQSVSLLRRGHTPLETREAVGEEGAASSAYSLASLTGQTSRKGEEFGDPSCRFIIALRIHSDLFLPPTLGFEMISTRHRISEGEIRLTRKVGGVEKGLIPLTGYIGNF